LEKMDRKYDKGSFTYDVHDLGERGGSEICDSQYNEKKFSCKIFDRDIQVLEN